VPAWFAWRARRLCSRAKFHAFSALIHTSAPYLNLNLPVPQIDRGATEPHTSMFSWRLTARFFPAVDRDQDGAQNEDRGLPAACI
jgi:hypothetical protein